MESLDMENVDATNLESCSYNIEYFPNLFPDNSINSELSVEFNEIPNDGQELTSNNQSENGVNIVKTNVTNPSLAKKRLKAYSKQPSKYPLKYEKGGPERQHVLKKIKKDMYPNEKARAVIEEIEELKRREVGHPPTNRRQLVANAIRSLHKMTDNSNSPDQTEQFKKREIKQRNYRRMDSFTKNSASPEVYQRSKGSLSPIQRPPQDWSEFISHKLPYFKEGAAKSYSKLRPHELLEQLYSFQGPPPILESYKYATENGIREVSPFSLRLTRSKPRIIYNTNVETDKDHFITRDQLFQFISEERQQTIINTINTHSKLQPLNKKISSKQWYSKVWRRSDAECKVLEKSVGLSFLQTYSDEEEDNETEEIVICSSINNKNNTSNSNKSSTDYAHYIKPQEQISESQIELYKSPVKENLDTEKTISEKYDSSPMIAVNKKYDSSPNSPINKNYGTSPITAVDKKYDASPFSPISKKYDVSPFSPISKKYDASPFSPINKKYNSSPILKSNEIPEDDTGILTPEIPLQLQKTFIRIEECSPDQKKILQDHDDAQRSHSRDIKKKKKKSKAKLDNLWKKKKNKKKTKKKKSSEEESLSSQSEKRKKIKTKRKSFKRKREKPVKSKLKLTKKTSAKEPKVKKKAEIASKTIKTKAAKKSKNKIPIESLEDEFPATDLRNKLKNKKKNKAKIADKEIERIIEYDEDVHYKKSKSKNESERSARKESRSFKNEKYNVRPTKVKTPDTEEYRGNWESEDESLCVKTQLNSSWESDEDLCEMPYRPNDSYRNLDEVLNLEIPLNIKPFKKRHLDPTKLDYSKNKDNIANRESETEKNKSVKHNLKSEVEVIQLRNIDRAEHPKYEDDDIKEVDVEKIVKLAVDRKHHHEKEEQIVPVVPEKKRRWDKKEVDPPIEKKIIKTLEHSTASNTSASLENEYVEFMKAVSSNTEMDSTNNKMDASIISISSNESVDLESENVFDKTAEQTLAQTTPTNVSVAEETDPNIIICPNDIPFIPMPDEVKEIATSSPKIEPKEYIMNTESISSVDSIFTPIEAVVSEKQDSLADSSTHEVVNVSKDMETGEVNVSQNKPFTFTTLILPSKKTLMHSSNVKLGDSDDESGRTMTSIEEIRKEHLLDSNVEPEEKQMNVLVTNVEPTEKEIEDVLPTLKKPAVPEVKVFRITPMPSERSEKKESSRKRHRQSSSRHSGHHSPRRESSPKRRRSPERYRDRRTRSSGERRYSSRKSSSPVSSRRKSPGRHTSPRSRSHKKLSYRDSRKTKPEEAAKLVSTTSDDQIRKSPSIASPLEGLKRSVADSTISDDSLLPQPNLEEFAHSPEYKSNEPKRISLDERINLELGWPKEELKRINASYNNFYSRNDCVDSSQDFPNNKDAWVNDGDYPNVHSSSNFVQMGNMVQIVPTDIPSESVRQEKCQILQVGNMLQIVPADLPPLPPEVSISPPPISTPTYEVETVSTEASAIEASINQKILERRAERDRRKGERDERRKEKEKRRREKEKQRNIKMKEKTENMIRRALQLEIENHEEEEGILTETPVRWPPALNISTCKDTLTKSILLLQGQRKSTPRKVVQFADGIRPGEGTSPSAGEELFSPPPSKVLPKEKRYTKTKLRQRNMKKKVKVKIIKPNSDTTQSETNRDDNEDEEEEEEDNLPPPSPPPGSPPPHIFPPRVKTLLNKISTYVSSALGNQVHTIFSSANSSLLLPQLQQLYTASAQQQPQLPETHLSSHHLAQYQVPILPNSRPPLPPIPSDSALGSSHRNSHLHKYAA